MKNESPRKLLIELDKLDALWVQKKEYNSEGASLSWLPVTTLCGGNFLLGLTSNGVWARSTEHFVQSVNQEGARVFFLPMLEGPPKEVRYKMVEGLKRYGLSEDFVNFFPFESIVVEGLRSQSEYWSGLALKWVLFIPRSSSFKAELEILSETGETQKIRQLARKLSKQLNTL